MTQELRIDDIETASLEELFTAQKALGLAIQAKQDAVQAQLARELQTLAQHYGLKVNISSCLSSKSKQPPKYRHPEKHDLTWCGIGMRPHWFKALEEQGVNRNDLRVPSEDGEAMVLT